MWVIGKGFNNSRGDTLVEVLVCIAIVSTILAGAFVVTGHSRQGVQNSQEHAKAIKLLESQLEQLRASAGDASAGGSVSPIFTHAGNFCMSNGAVQPASSTDCKIGSGQPVYELSISRTGSDNTGYVFTANTRWAQITNGYANEQLSYRLYNN